ncbi:MAG TPA: hypothetical protein VLB79_02000 [Solirubrobacterales bacterium]|nr:hypothetical protein [Solirubrobacterales bacterium]
MLDLHCEYVVVKLGPKRPEALAKLVQHIGSNRHPLPAALPQYVNATTKEVDIDPPAADDLCAAEAHPFHQKDRGPLVPDRCYPHPPQFLQTRPVHVGNGQTTSTPANGAAVSQYEVACFQVSQTR